MLVIVHGRYPGESIAFDPSSARLGGGPKDDLRLHGLPHGVVRIDASTDGCRLVHLDRTIEVAVDGAPHLGQRLRLGNELWIEDFIVRLASRLEDPWADIARRDAVTRVSNMRYFESIVETHRDASKGMPPPWCLAYVRLVAPPPERVPPTGYREPAPPHDTQPGFRVFRRRHGNIVAHRLLRAAGAQLIEHMPGRAIGRVHGWTFAVLLPGRAVQHLAHVEILRKRIAAIEVQTREGRAGLDCIAVVIDGTSAGALAEIELRAFNRLEDAEASSERATHGVRMS
jgi:hypothetical protein